MRMSQGSRLVDRCRELDPETTPSTVYRTLDLLEELGVISHSHGLDGREEFHVQPAFDHGHLDLPRRVATRLELQAEEAAGSSRRCGGTTGLTPTWTT